jgi:hypothetical protein
MLARLGLKHPIEFSKFHITILDATFKECENVDPLTSIQFQNHFFFKSVVIKKIYGIFTVC